MTWCTMQCMLAVSNSSECHCYCVGEGHGYLLALTASYLHRVDDPSGNKFSTRVTGARVGYKSARKFKLKVKKRG